MHWDDFALVPQIGSAIIFPGVTLDFDNDFEPFARKSVGLSRRK